MRILAFAKLNLSLRVTGVLPDGYHSLESVMQSVSLADMITITPREGEGVTLACSDPALAGEDNLVARACEAFFARAGRRGGFDIYLEKRIPVAAGLGGGSSDAAATLNALNLLFRSPLKISELEDLALTVGSDVPFMIRGGCALARGRGEELCPLKRAVRYYYVIVKTGEKTSTGEAYAELDRRGRSCDAPSPDYERLVNDISYFGERSANDFAEVAPASSALKADFYAAGAENIALSGAGPALFSVFRDWSSALGAFRYLRAKYPLCFLAADTSRGSLVV